MACATFEELGKLSPMWYTGTLGSQVSAKITHLKEKPMIDQIDHYVRLTRDVTIPAMQVHRTVGVARVPILTKQLNAITEALPHREEIKGGGNRITIGLTKTTQEKIVLKRGTRVATVFVVNVVPPMLAPKMRMDAKILEITIPPPPFWHGRTSS